MYFENKNIVILLILVLHDRNDGYVTEYILMVGAQQKFLSYFSYGIIDLADKLLFFCVTNSNQAAHRYLQLKNHKCIAAV